MLTNQEDLKKMFRVLEDMIIDRDKLRIASETAMLERLSQLEDDVCNLQNDIYDLNEQIDSLWKCRL
jgi:Na+/phosphate symporter